MAKASRSGRTAGATSGEQPKSGKEFYGMDGNGEFFLHDGKGNRLPFDPNEMVSIGTTLTPEQREFVRQMPLKTPSANDVARSDGREQMERWEERREARQKDERDATFKAFANAVADAMTDGQKASIGPQEEVPSGPKEKGPTWQKVLPRAESYVQRNGFYGLKALARALSCHHTVLRKAIDNSEKLRAAEKQHLDQKKATIPK